MQIYRSFVFIFVYMKSISDIKVWKLLGIWRQISLPPVARGLTLGRDLPGLDNFGNFFEESNLIYSIFCVIA